MAESPSPEHIASMGWTALQIEDAQTDSVLVQVERTPEGR